MGSVEGNENAIHRRNAREIQCWGECPGKRLNHEVGPAHKWRMGNYIAFAEPLKDLSWEMASYFC